MSIAKNYSPESIETNLYNWWLEKNFFHSEPDNRQPYTIVIPPPNVTGVLHLGHCLNNTIQDILIRRARQKGYNACWVPGTDHASIATETKVVLKLQAQGINKFDLTREEFLKHAWDWTKDHQNIIYKQLQKLGVSCDWQRKKFTLDDDLYKSVIKFFVDLYNKGLIYRDKKIINWDPVAKTSLSDLEVEYKETQGNLYYVKYKLVDNPEDFLIVATTRPETILADTAICVNPNDSRYTQYHGKKVFVPIINRIVPVITDEYVDPEFGTGVLKITPAHDPADYEIGIKHNLEIINIFNDDATLNENAQYYIGFDRFQARKAIVEDMEKQGLLVKIEPYVHNVGYSQRTMTPIEPRISKQWFVRMEPLIKEALENVMNDTIKFFPPMYKNTYKHWMENIKDWNISRQLWWGHRIPAYYLKNTELFFVAETIEEALEQAKKATNNTNLTVNDLEQDPDVLDTWFSSALWPLSVFNGILEPENEDIKYYYPTTVLVTGYDIIFFWVARMIISGYFYRQQQPFKHVYFTGLIRDELGRKMSKQLGNSPDPLELIDKYGADGLRFGLMLCAPAGNDLIYKADLPEIGKNFANKIWNAGRLIESWTPENIEQPSHSKIAIEWFKAKFYQTLENIEKLYEVYKISEITNIIYNLFWEDFASWYLEIVKPLPGRKIDANTYSATREFFDKLLRVIHPIMPFVTEELWQKLNFKTEKYESIVIAPYPQLEEYDIELIEKFESIQKIITNVRRIRQDLQIKNSESITLYYRIIEGKYDDSFDPVIKRAANVNEIVKIDDKILNAETFIVKNVEYFIKQELDSESAKEKLDKLLKELEYTKGFLASVENKLNNEKFIQNAPQNVVEREKQKYIDALNRIKALEEQIDILKKTI